MPDLSDTPAGHISRLDNSLLRKGEPVTVMRRIGESDDDFKSIGAQAKITGYQGDEIIGGVEITDSKFIISPSPFDADVDWFDGADGPLYPERGDFIVNQGRRRHIEQCIHIKIGVTVVRIEGRIR